MNILKQNTDYAMRIMANLARRYKPDNTEDQLASTSNLAASENISAPFAAKILQNLAKAGLVDSVMGKDGGFRIARNPAEISLNDIIEAVQGRITINKCSPGICSCPHQPNCGVSSVLCEIEADIINKFSAVKLSNL